MNILRRDDIKKVTPDVAAWIEDYYKHPNQYPHNMIAELVSAACKGAGKEGICRETVTEYVNRPENKNRLMMYRNPEQFRKVNQPRLRRLKAENPCDLAYGDGTPLQIPCWNKKGDKLVRLQLYVILDQCSGFIGGFSLSETEDRYSILGAMEMFVSMTGYLPHTYKHDNASGNNAEEWLQFRMKALIAGCNAEPCKPGEPTAKADIERFFGTFQSYQRMVNGFIGEGVRSKRDTGRVDIDFLKAYHKKEGYYSYETMVEVVTRLINAYNQTETARKEAPSAIFARNKPNGIRVSTEQKAFLFWPYKTIKVMQSEVVFKIRHAVYIYKVYDHETALLLNGKQVRVYYQESDLSEVCLFDEHDQYITSIKQKVLVHAAPVNQTDGDVQQIIKQTAHNHSIKTFVKSETKKISDNLTDDPDIILTSPLTHTKEKFDNAETDHMLDYMRDRYSIDRNNVSEFETVETVDSSNDVRTRYSKKHTPKKPSLAILD